MIALWLAAHGCAVAEPLRASPTTAVVAAPATDVSALAWLSGRWIARDPDGAVTEETWTEPAPDAMFGVSRTVAGDRTAFFEYLRIELDAATGTIAYVAAPKGRCPPVRFEAVEVAPDHVRFENPAHDDPKVIEYRRDGDRLTATIDGEGGPRGWTFERG